MAAGSVDTVGSAMMVFIEGLSQHSMIFVNVTFNFTQVAPVYTAIVGEQYGRIEPEFAFAIRGSNMNMGRLISLIRVEMKPERANAQDGGHEIRAAEE
ncbi:MAG: hypothetical protein U0984_05365 [Prosthecobacter sp.]|nr:hypothetical protein [Prosthecobacter sp.]